ncbi:MAG: 3-deoxy-manno-octulosonate cytidylyltransferase [Bacteroidales bacterium]|jgi:3-deoxy-manno-octulosonate cytidylyltransferase (CMP-KDO synthetase)|nr:3-deoxy-manno-octulosonate cytidylyltransferase [Bacteroidales bacterium]
MKIIGVIPARYESSRLPGKPLADICGKPMIWWVYQQAKKSSKLDFVYAAIDDERVELVCRDLDIPVIMTNQLHRSHINRLHEVSQKIEADMYVCICGDEPLIKVETIEQVIPSEIENDAFIARSLMRVLSDPAETVDPSNLKLVTDTDGYGLMITRSVIPFPQKTSKFIYKKVVGVECYNKTALDFFAASEAGFLEKIEDTNLLRFIENHKPIRFIMTDAYQLSVDTSSDLEKVRGIVSENLKKI